jgi:hypothetical protein
MITLKSAGFSHFCCGQLLTFFENTATGEEVLQLSPVFT